VHLQKQLNKVKLIAKSTKIRDMTTAYYTHADCKRHEMGSWHPESPERLQAIEDQLIASRISTLLDHRDAPSAEESDLARVHTADAIYRIRENCPSEHSEYDHFPLDADTALNSYTWRACLRAAGAAIAATDAVIDAEIENAFARYGHRDIMPAAKNRWDSACLTTSRLLPVMRSMCAACSVLPSLISMCITAMAPKIFSVMTRKC
jgi:hypothetical protein